MNEFIFTKMLKSVKKFNLSKVTPAYFITKLGHLLEGWDGVLNNLKTTPLMSYDERSFE